MKEALVVGGGSGIGLSIVLRLIERGYEKVHIVGKDKPNINDIDNSKREIFELKTDYEFLDLAQDLGDCFDKFDNIDTLIITAGFGRVAPFENLKEKEIDNLVKVNMQSIIRIIEQYYSRLISKEPFYCAVMGSIAGHIVSPLFSVYGAAKAGLCSFIENINTELAHAQTENRILDVSPGSLKGTKFSGGENSLEVLSGLCDEIIDLMIKRETLFIPKYEAVYKDVIRRYRENPQTFGLESYDYKIKRISNKPQLVIGYLSGTFDLFHIGHLRLLQRAKAQCDYLIVGVHKSGAWKGKETFIPFDERLEIVKNIKYVDKAIESFAEDVDAYKVYHYNKLFVGSDYKGTERFNNYEKYFADKDVEIVYFPYTKGTSSTQLREAIKK